MNRWQSLLFVMIFPALCGGRCTDGSEPICTADGGCGWDSGGCFVEYTEVGRGECRDPVGAVPARYISLASVAVDIGREGVSWCEDTCLSREDCYGVRELAYNVSESQCVLYVVRRSEQPPKGFEFMDGTAGVGIVSASGDVAETPSDANAWICKSRPCDETDCACTLQDCPPIQGFKGGCVCSRTMTMTEVPMEEECVPGACGEGQDCRDPVPEFDSRYDFVCTCRVSGEVRVGGALPVCEYQDDCSKAPCYAGQTCTDETPYPAAAGDFWCACTNAPAIRRQGGPVRASGCALLDECNPSPCFFPQSCIDPNTSISSTGDYVCTCPDGTDKVGGSLAVCDYDECTTNPCGDEQICQDINHTSDSLGDFSCVCHTSGTAVGTPANCTSTTAPTATPSDTPETTTPATDAPPSFVEEFWWIFAAGGGVLVLVIIVLVVCLCRKRAVPASAPVASEAVPGEQTPQPLLPNTEKGKKKKKGDDDNEAPYMFPPAYLMANVPAASMPIVQYSSKKQNMASLVKHEASSPAQFSPLGGPMYSPPMWETPGHLQDTLL